MLGYTTVLNQIDSFLCGNILKHIVYWKLQKLNMG
jgi:hypothetical protein